MDGPGDQGETDVVAAQLQQEQLVVDDVYARLDALREQASAQLQQVRATSVGGSHQARSERDSFSTLYADRLATYDAVEQRLLFGRIDLREDDDEKLSSRYVGRIGLSDADHTPVLTDWRAPAARPFYQATAARPGGVVRRRHVATRGRVVTGIEDDVLDVDQLDDDTRAGLAGEGALLAALGAHRTGRMHDIVATIQSEQDEIIRSDVEGVLVVQGGPGTGKTAVALHRAAYLLYAHRERLARSGVLMVGPSDAFLTYIERVLPALGETGVVSTTMASLLPDVVASAPEDPAVARVKGRAAMAGVISRAVAARQRVPAETITVRVGSHELEIRPDDVAAARSRARRAHQPHNGARTVFVRTMLSTLARQYAAQLGSDVSGEDLAGITEDIRSERDVRVHLNLAWMPLTPEGLVRDLWSKPHRLLEAAPSMSRADRALLQRDRGAPWTEADVPLIDEAAELIGERIDPERARAEAEAEAQQRAEIAYARDSMQASGAGGGMVSAETLAARFADTGPVLTTAERAASDRSWTYGHIVVDEAQELSAMAWRVLLRRCPSRSFTVVGDTGQTSSGAGADRWSDVFDAVVRGSWRQAELTINYRTPASVMDAATAVLRAAAERDGVELTASPVVSARDLDGALRISEGTVEDEVARSRELGGTTAVIAPRAQLAGLRERLGVTGTVDLTAPVVVLDPVAAKGLEFDAVVALDVGSMARGDAYVAMTRPTRSLTLVGNQPVGLPGS
ncbi:HelD family protein [Serinibacter arcticus]|uniref:HelD family protein n=1 Tax=Serinibacter arcticus TaxID=1655435 RepID=UPI001F386431|nr:AAA family ATPase [Serinibacter arcticus]